MALLMDQPIKVPLPLTKLGASDGIIGCITSHPFTYPTKRRFEVFWPVKDRGTYARIGVVTMPQLPVYLHRNVNRWGYIGERWLWDLRTKQLLHLPLQPDQSMDDRVSDGRDSYDFELPETFCMELDLADGKLSFVIGEQNLGVAFEDLKGKELYLAFFTGFGEFKDLNVGLLTFNYEALFNGTL